MAKIIFFAFIALVCAQQIQAELLDEIQNATVTHIDAIAEGIHKEVAIVKEIVNETVTDAQHKVENGLSHVKSTFEDATAKINKAVSDFKNGILAKKECKIAYAALVRSYDNLVERTNACVDNHIQRAFGHLNKIVHVADDILNQLNSIKDRAITVCSTENRHGLMEFAKVSMCYGKCIMDSTFLLTKHAPYATMETAKLTAYVATLGPKVTYCTSVESFSAVYNDFRSNLGKIKDCLL